MPSIFASHTDPQTGGVHPALLRFADEARGVLTRLFAYVGSLAIIAMVGLAAWNEIQVAEAVEPAARASWAPAARSYPAFAVGQFDFPGKTEAYEIFRHPGGGRKDVIRWTVAQAEKPIAEIELYRPGAELSQAGPPAAEIAARMDSDEMREIAGEGIVDSKFGPVTLLGFADRPNDGKRCLGFMKNLEGANLRISGWSCQGETLPARRSAIRCILNRLGLLTAGNDPKLSDIFARAELKGGTCVAPGTSTVTSADWVTGAQNPRLRGAL